MDSAMKTSRILLVDDDASSLATLSLILESESVEIASAAHGGEAVERLKETHCDMIITDFHMPGTNGIELAMKARELQPGIPVILITCEIVPDLVEAAATAGISRILSKPINKVRLFEVIQHIFRRHQNNNED